MPRKVAKRSYKKRSYKSRRYKRRYRRRFYRRRAIKKPEIYIIRDNLVLPMGGETSKNGVLNRITTANSESIVGIPDVDTIEFKINDKLINGRKIRLKYLYIKGYVEISDTESLDDNINGKIYVFRQKRNMTNDSLRWADLVDAPISGIDLTDPTSWTDEQRRAILYMYDWKNDIKNNVKKNIRNIYAKYDNVNNLIPFKIRVPLYDCVLTCDTYYSSGSYAVQANPSTNSLYIGALFTGSFSNAWPIVNLKYKLYYTDY